jgi:hypothetical protein
MNTFQVPNPTIGIVQPLLSLTVGTTIFVVKKFNGGDISMFIYRYISSFRYEMMLLSVSVLIDIKRHVAI